MYICINISFFFF
ncbi:hypothetical protein cmbei_8005530, partial [Cryptosporidium meleagridis]